MKGNLLNRTFLVDGVKCEYCGTVLIDNGNGGNYRCCVIKVENINRLNQWDTPSSSKDYGYSYELLEKYGIYYTEYGKKLHKERGVKCLPTRFDTGKMTHELSRSDFEPQYQTVYDTTRTNGGGFVVMSPLASMLYTMGNLFKK
jgi:hypothetical protein